MKFPEKKSLPQATLFHLRPAICKISMSQLYGLDLQAGKMSIRNLKTGNSIHIHGSR